MTQVWYVSYGSNMAAARLACYLRGGSPAGGTRANPGARDSTLPTRSVPVDLPGTTYFAGRSPQWGGGVACYDHHAAGFTAARGHLLTRQQLVDIAAQEMYRLPRPGDPLEEVLLEPLPGGRHTLGPGRYETLVEVGRLEDLPMLTITAAGAAAAAQHVPPSSSYRAVLVAGLGEGRGWSAARAESYLDALVVGDDPRATSRRGARSGTPASWGGPGTR